ncbi:hypothetical protein MMC20_000319 [Loxospora ochrophaea]|nr:hypothetical protein [Loxospora ochrophaea]
MASHHIKAVQANLLYMLPDSLHETTKPYYIAGIPPAGRKQSNETFVPKETEIINARWNERKFSIKENGFQWVNCPFKSAVESVDDCQKYMRYMEEFLKEHLNAEQVYAYEYVIRQQREHGVSLQARDRRETKRTIHTAHLDITPRCATDKVRSYLPPEEAERLLQSNWQIVNAWRPLVDVVKSQPLAVCHSASLREKDLIACDMIYPHVTTEIFHVLHNPNQKWYFLREQKQDEVLLMRNYGPNGALGVAHTAFNDPTSEPEAQARRSIELRCFVSYSLNGNSKMVEDTTGREVLEHD